MSGQTPNREALGYNTDFWLLSTQEVIRGSAQRKQVTKVGKKDCKNEGTAIVNVIDTNLCQKVTKREGGLLKN